MTTHTNTTNTTTVRETLPPAIKELVDAAILEVMARHDPAVAALLAEMTAE